MDDARFPEAFTAHLDRPDMLRGLTRSTQRTWSPGTCLLALRG